MSTILLVAAMVLALISTALGFGWFDTTTPGEEVVGWLGAAFTCYVASHLVPD